MTARLLDAALWYAGRGWHVLACEPGGKRPIVPAWQVNATTDPDTIREWWHSTPDANVGLLCGPTFDVLDIEAAGISALADWLALGGEALPEGPLATTGRGGFHAYWPRRAGRRPTCGSATCGSASSGPGTTRCSLRRR